MKLNGKCFVVYHADNEIAFFYIKSWYTCAYSVYFKSKKELNYNRFVDPNVRGVIFFNMLLTLVDGNRSRRPLQRMSTILETILENKSII